MILYHTNVIPNIMPNLRLRFTAFDKRRDGTGSPPTGFSGTIATPEP